MKKLMNRNKKFYVLIIIIASVIFAASAGMFTVGTVYANKISQITGNSENQGSMPEGFDSENMPEGFDSENMPEGFDSENMPEGFDSENMPQKTQGGVDASGSTDGSGSPEMPQGGTEAGGNTDGSDIPEMPQGETEASGNTDGSGSPEMPQGEADASGNTDGGGSPEMPQGGTDTFGSSDDANSPQMPGGNMSDGSMPENNFGQNVFLTNTVFRIVMLIIAVLSAIVDVWAVLMLVRRGKNSGNIPGLPDNGQEPGNADNGNFSESEEYEAETGNTEDFSNKDKFDPVAERLKKRKKTRIKLIILAAIVVIAIVVIEILSNRNSDAQSVNVEESVIEATVEDGTLSKTLKSSGIISSAAETDISIPGNIEVTQYFVSDGDVVEEGDVIASVDKNSVLGAIADVEELISQVDEQMMDVKDESISSVISAPYDVKVAAVYAQAGEDVTDVMYENGSLMLLSLDGLYAVDVDYSGSCKVGDEVSISDSSGDEHTGNISEVKKAGITVTVDMDECSLGDEVEVSLSDGTSLGTGKLYINSELVVTGFSGTVSSVSVSEGSEVSSGNTLMTLEDTDYTAKYQSLLSKRLTLVDQYNELVKIAATGFVTASETGTISGVDSSLTTGSVNNSGNSEALSASTYDTRTTQASSVYETQTAAVQTTYGKSLMSTGSEYSYMLAEATSSIDGEAIATVAETTEIPEENNQEQNQEEPGEQGGDQQEGGQDNPGGSGQEEEPGSNPGEESTALEDAKKLIDEETRALVIGTGNTSKTVQVIWIGSDGAIKTSGLPAELIIELESGDKIVDVEALQADESGNWTYTWNELSDSAEFDIDVVTNSLEGYTTAVSRIGSVTLLVNVEKASGNGNQNIPGGNDSDNNKESSETPSSENNGFSNSNGTIVSQNGSYGFSSTTDDISDLATETEEESTYTMSETVLCQLTPNDKVSIDITVDELDIGSVSAGQDCIITLDAITGQSFEGTVSHKDPTGDNDGGNTKYTVTVTLDKTENMLLGMNASVSIELETIEGIPVVPEEALYEIDGKTCIYTSYDKKTDELGDPVVVETGLSDGINAQISSGLEEGDTYYYRYGSSIEYVF